MATDKNPITALLSSIMGQAAIEFKGPYAEISDLTSNPSVTDHERRVLNEILKAYTSRNETAQRVGEDRILQSIGITRPSHEFNQKVLSPDFSVTRAQIFDFSGLNPNLGIDLKRLKLNPVILEALERDPLYKAFSRLSRDEGLNISDQSNLYSLANSRGVKMIKEAEQSLGVKILPEIPFTLGDKHNPNALRS